MTKTKENMEKKEDLGKYEILQKRRGIFLMATSLFLAFVLLIVGILIGEKSGSSSQIIAKITLALSCILPITMFPLNILLTKLYVKKFNQMNVQEIQHYLLSHRDCAQEMALQKLNFIQKCRFLTDVYAILFFLFGMIAAFCGGILYDNGFSTFFCFVSAFLFLTAFSRIRFPISNTFFEDDKTYVDMADFPELYAMVQKAAKTLGCDGEIKITLSDDFNAGIGKFGNTYSVQLGVILLNLLSKTELYSVLLHEFAHIVNDKDNIMKETLYQHWIMNGTNPHALSDIVSLLYSFADMLYCFHFSLYRYAVSVVIETSADQKMMEHGDANYAASALLKAKYHDLYLWEEGTIDTECIFAPAQISQSITRNKINAFKKVLTLRMDDWNRLVDVEILSRSASHPTLKMRLQTLGISTPVIMDSDDPLSYKAECDKAIDYVDNLIAEENIGHYEEDRKLNYLEPKELIEEWEANQKPLKAETYADILHALRQLGRYSQANELCDRAIQELDETAACLAYYMKGNFLLHSYDASGIDYIYRAMENNSNYIEEGLEMIGLFCCLTGSEKDLEHYRQKAVELTQKQRDFYDEMNILNKKDQLVPEHLPEEIFDGIMTFIHSIDNGSIQNVYLVRKIISKDFFTSAFIVRFEENTDADVQEKILHKIFFYLDTCADWQFSLFEYSEVKSVKVEKIEHSCVYEKN